MGAATKNKGRPRIEESGRDFGLLDTIRETYPGISNRAAQNKLYQLSAAATLSSIEAI